MKAGKAVYDGVHEYREPAGFPSIKSISKLTSSKLD